MTRGAGTDIVSVRRIANLISDRGASFLERWFTAHEIAYCNDKAHPDLHFAARLAAKEAVLKALRPPDGPIPWLDIEIWNDANGAPEVRLTGSMLETARRNGVQTITVSLSHCDEFATAMAITDTGWSDGCPAEAPDTAEASVAEDALDAASAGERPPEHLPRQR